MQSKGLGPVPGALTDREGVNTYLPGIDASGKQWTLQTILEDGSKRFAKGGRMNGSFHVVGGDLAAIEKADVLILAEGYATAASVREAADRPVIAAFNAGNLKPVAEALHARFPDKPILIAGDDDRRTELKIGTNPGRDKAAAAAEAVGGRTVFPQFAPGEVEAEPRRFTDFNDLAMNSAMGKEGLERQIKAAVAELQQERQPDRPVPSVETPVTRELDSAFVEQLASRVQREVTPPPAATIDTPDLTASLPWKPGDVPTRAFVETASPEARVAVVLLDAALAAQFDRLSDREGGEAQTDRAQQTLARALEDREVLSMVGKQGLTRGDVTEFARDDPAVLVQVLATAARSLQFDRDVTRTFAPDVNSIGAAPELARGPAAVREAEATGAEPAATAGRDGPSFKIGDVPADVDRRYHTENSHWRDQRGFYEGAAAKDPAFHDRGNKLVSGMQSPAVIADMVDIAKHRQWSSIVVTGTEEFRREVWLHAREQSLEVRGFKPNERDLQELTRRQEQLAERRDDTIAPDRGHGGRDATDRESRAPGDKATAPNFTQGIDGKIVDVGRAEFNDKANGKTTPFVDLERPDGEKIRAWGVGLPPALAEAGKGIGDVVTLQRQGKERVQVKEMVEDKATGERHETIKDVDRNKWSVTAAGPQKEHDARAVPATAGNDREDRAAKLVGADRNASAQIKLVEEVVARVLPDNPREARKLVDETRNDFAARLERGERIAPPQVRTARDRTPDRAPAQLRVVGGENKAKAPTPAPQRRMEMERDR